MRQMQAGVLTLLFVAAAFAQNGNPKEGESLFRANCSPCHGLNARGGGRGPDLTQGRWNHGGSDDAIFRTISQGVPGTEMPGNSFIDSETWSLVAYLRSLQTTGKAAQGDPKAGEKLFSGKLGCAACHMVNGRGGHLGPDLSRVGAARSADYLLESIREPDKDLSLGYTDPNNHYGNPLEYDTVVVTLANGKKLAGIAKNEDAFTLQLLGQDDELHLFEKKNLASVVHEHRSLMPKYDSKQLPAREAEDLVAYLVSLRGAQ